MCFSSLWGVTPYNDPQWHHLLHLRDDNRSEIADPRFFLSNPFSPENELKAHIDILKTDKKCETICKFPARYTFLNHAMDLNITFDHCGDVKSFLKETNGESASLVFASSYLGSPMSYFGHTFIKINKKNNIHFSQTLSYAAEIPQQTGLFSLLGKGISGGFSGKYVISPYFKLLEGYNVVEQRSLAEYKLDLTPQEIEMMTLHAYEMADIVVPYRFFTENCAYEMVWFLDVARPSLNLHQKFNGIVIPYETTDYLKSTPIVTHITSQPSNIELLYHLYGKMNPAQKSFFGAWKESASKVEMLEKSSFSREEKSSLAYMMNGYYDILFKKFRTAKADFMDVKSVPFYPIKERFEGDVLRAKGSSKVSVGQFWNHGKSGQEIDFKPILFNRYDDKASDLNEGTLELLSFQMRHSDDKSYLESYDIVKLESYTKRFDFYTPLSWRFRIGGDRMLSDRKLRSTIQVGSGVMYGNESVSWYVIPQFEGYNDTVGTSVLGGVSWWTDHGHYGVEAKTPLWFSAQHTRPYQEAYVVIPLFDRWMVRGSYRSLHEEVRVNVGLRF